MAAIRYRRIFTLILFVCLLLGAAAADEILDAPSLSSCLDCGFPEGHDSSCLAYVPDSHVPDVSDSCLECGAVAPEHLEGCLLYVPDAPVEPPVSSEAELPSSDPLPEGIPVEPLSFAEEMLVETSEPVAVYDAKSTDQPLTMTIDGVEYICFDLAAGDVDINANTYTGYVLEGLTRQKKTGTHSPSNRYYIYQSTNDYKPTISDNTLSTLPKYDRVSSPLDSGTWGDYITNNSDVESVIKNWKTSAWAVGRTDTAYKISVSGSKTYDVTIDNLWSSYQYKSQSRTTGGLSFTPDTNGRLTVHLVGDNRFGNIHYDATTEQKAQIIFTSDSSNPGTLTVANIKENADTNHYDSAIGGNDSGAGNAVGIIFNGGIIFAGTTPGDNCSAIGGGGNDIGDITIKDGTVTAVAESSGAAIGGGIGNSQMGGPANVTITGGFVYAYNNGSYGTSETDNPFIPAAAIGGGSSCEKSGNRGEVSISGGFVYAQSRGGAAIGGGSSTKASGGEAVVTITGGTVIAKSVGGVAYPSGTENSGWDPFPVTPGTGIGGGTAGKLGKGSGGVAQLTVSGDAEVNTGSIGGGGVANAYGSIGKAVVTIFGGTLLGQVIMEGTGSSFRMEGGVIDNTNRAGYNFLKGDGGAVWIKAGNAQMSGGTINNTDGEKGGAIYVEGGSFTMSGGNITDVSAGNGGAVYVNVTDGSNKVSFTMTGGTIQNAKATATDNGGAVSAGNGGAVSVENGKVSLGGSARITNTTATSNGGAIYVSGGTVTMSGGTISDVSASNGGAIYVNAGSPGVDSFTMTGGTIQNAKATATDNGGGGAVYLSKGNFVMDSGSLLNNNATCNGGGAYVSDGSIIIGNGTLCALEKNSTHSHPIVKDNEAKNGGAFAIFGGTLSVYCGNYSGNNATNSESDSIYQEDGYIYIYKGVDNESLPFNETFIRGNTFVYTDDRLPLLTVQLYNSTKANVSEYVSKFVVDSSIYHSIRLNKSLLPAASLIPEDSNPMLIGWSLNKSDTCVTIKENSSSYYPEESKYPVTVGGYVNIYAIWGQSDKNYTIIIPDTIEITDDNNIRIGIDESEPFFIPNEVGRLNINLSQMDSSLSLLNTDISLEYKLKDKNGNELKVDDIVASFTYNQSKNYSNQGVTLTAEITDDDDDNEPVYAGTYSGIVTFSCSLVIDDYDQDKTDSKTCYTSSSLTSGVAS